MATELTYPLINGVRYEWSSLEISLAPVNGGSSIYIGIKEISYKQGLKPTYVYGTSAQPIGRTRGVLEPSASITLYKSEAVAFRNQLGDGYLEKVFDIVIKYSENGFDTVTDEVRGCRIQDDDDSHSQGADALITKLDLHPMLVIKNGLNPLTNMLKGITT